MSGKKETKNEGQNEDKEPEDKEPEDKEPEDKEPEDQPEPSNHPLEGFSCSKDELEQENEQQVSKDSVQPEALGTLTCSAEPEVECEEQPVPKTVIDENSQPSDTAPVVEASQVPCTPAKADVLVEDSQVFVEESQEYQPIEYFQEDQTPPEWNEGDGVTDDSMKPEPGVANDTMQVEPASIPTEPTSGCAELSQPTTPSKEHLEALEKGEEKEDLKSDDEDLAKRQAFKAGFKVLRR